MAFAIIIQQQNYVIQSEGMIKLIFFGLGGLNTLFSNSLWPISSDDTELGRNLAFSGMRSWFWLDSDTIDRCDEINRWCLRFALAGLWSDLIASLLAELFAKGNQLQILLNQVLHSCWESNCFLDFALWAISGAKFVNHL